MKITICILQPAGYIHSLALLEVGEYFKCKLEGLHHKVELVKNRFDWSGLNIVLGAHTLREKVDLPRQTIIFNSEQFGKETIWNSNSFYLDSLRRNFIWDYSRQNLENFDSNQSTLVEFGYEQKLDRIKSKNKSSIDLLFYGSVNPRRKLIIQKLLESNVKVKIIQNIYAGERDLFISESKCILNLHFYETQIFQTVRCFYPLTNRIPILTESYDATSVSNHLNSAIFCDFNPDINKFVEFSRSTLSLLESSQSVLTDKFQGFKAFDVLPSIDTALSMAVDFFKSSVSVSAFDHSKGGLSRRLHIGSGKDYKNGYINIDVNESVSPDVILDLSQYYKFPINVRNRSGEDVIFDEESFDEIIVNDVLEHILDLTMFMTNCLTILCVGGSLKIQVPYELSLGAWQDPTHVRAFNENSWKYYTDWFWYLGWFKYRFSISALSFKPSKFGSDMLARKSEVAELLRTPRAIESMSVVLTKVETTPEERTQARSYLAGLFPD